jgi:hypothetical protein
MRKEGAKTSIKVIAAKDLIASSIDPPLCLSRELDPARQESYSVSLPRCHESRILILTNPTDPHSILVREALRQKGVDPLLWHTSDFPTVQAGSVGLHGRSCSWEIAGPEIEIRNSSVSTVWLRRPHQPVLPASIDPADRIFATRECSLFLRSLYNEIGAGAFWVNPLESQGKTILKSEQLKIASSAGFKIPRTLCSNEPAKIRDFLRCHQSGVIYKPFFSMSWETKEGMAIVFSSVLREDDLPEDLILRVTPGIFQELISKSYELRITAIGNRLFPVKLRSQETVRGKVDWRVAGDTVPMEPARLPRKIAAACRRVMSDFGIVFGCFDVVVTPGGEYVFLEVNEAGAFLWIEEQLPELRLLDAFCEFLLQARKDFKWRKSACNVRLSQVREAANRYLEIDAPRLHVTSSMGRPKDQEL